MTTETVTGQLIIDHLEEGNLEPGGEVALRVDQCLLQDATGTLVMLELEVLGLDRIEVDLASQHVDHNLIQGDNRNADDHLFLLSACQRYGLHYCRPGTGVSHAVHMQEFGVPGRCLAGSDSHSCAAGGLGMLAFGCGGVEVALALAGEPLRIVMPEVWGIELRGELPDWVSAKDVVLEMLRRFGVDGGLGRVLEYRGEGLAGLDVWDRHVIANMGAELGATTTVFPSDGRTRDFLERHGRAGDWRRIEAGDGARYDREIVLDLDRLEPLIALPSSPGNVVPVREVAGEPVYQAYLGSSANPGHRDFAIAAHMVKGRVADPGVSFDINPSTRRVLEDLSRDGSLQALVQAGARLHQAGCNGCIGMGQAPATGRNSLRTVPRNFPGRSGTPEDSVFLCSPETAVASALFGEITDPRTLGIPCPPREQLEAPAREGAGRRDLVSLVVAPLADDAARRVALVKGPNITTFPELEPLPEDLVIEVLLELGDDVSTDEILPAGMRVLPFRSNPQRIAEFCFKALEPDYMGAARRLLDQDDLDGHAVIAGNNYGQGSSREHAALAPRLLGLRVVVARSFARIHWQNLVNFGVLPLRFADEGAADLVHEGSRLRFPGLRSGLEAGGGLRAIVEDAGGEVGLVHDLSPRQVRYVLAGGVLAETRTRRGQAVDAGGDRASR
ncbi:MAG: aconitate hydratase [Planctomycetota bacterium]